MAALHEEESEFRRKHEPHDVLKARRQRLRLVPRARIDERSGMDEPESAHDHLVASKHRVAYLRKHWKRKGGSNVVERLSCVAGSGEHSFNNNKYLGNTFTLHDQRNCHECR